MDSPTLRTSLLKIRAGVVLRKFVSLLEAVEKDSTVLDQAHKTLQALGAPANKTSLDHISEDSGSSTDVDQVPDDPPAENFPSELRKRSVPVRDIEACVEDDIGTEGLTIIRRDRAPDDQEHVPEPRPSSVDETHTYPPSTGTSIVTPKRVSRVQWWPIIKFMVIIITVALGIWKFVVSRKNNGSAAANTLDLTIVLCPQRKHPL